MKKDEIIFVIGLAALLTLVLTLSHYVDASEFRLPPRASAGDTITAYVPTGATEPITSGTAYIVVTWRLNHAVVSISNSTLLSATQIDNSWSLETSYTPATVGVLTLTADEDVSGTTAETVEVSAIDDNISRIDAIAQVLSASPVTTATAIIVTGGTIVDRADGGWGSRLYPRFVPSGGQGETVQSGYVYNLSTGVTEIKYWADIFDFIQAVTGTVQAKIRTPLFSGIDAIETHILAEAYPSGWGGTRTTENPSFAKP